MDQPAQRTLRKGWKSSPKNPSKPEGRYKPDYSLEHVNYVSLREEPDGSENVYGLERHQIRQVKREQEYLIVGFDTEYVTPKDPVDNDKIERGRARYKVLSYQFHAKTQDGIEWNGIIIPTEHARVSFSDFIVYVVGKGLTEGVIEKVPNQIYLVAHYNRADIPAFYDSDDLIKRLSNIRKSLVTKDLPIKLRINFMDDLPPSEKEEDVLNIYIRDTILLAPTGQKSLSELGKLVGCKKVLLSEDKEREKYLKENMDVLLRYDWELFREYALIDAEVCVRYFDNVARQYEQITGSRRVPTALSNIGVKLLLQLWKDSEQPIDHLSAIGKQEFAEVAWNKEKQQFITSKRRIFKEEISWFIDFATECYHGGRNEQFWYGPSYIAEWSDYDLTGAYPTAMALIGMPKWDEVYSSTSINDYTPLTLGFACIDFEFDESIRYPTLPIRTNNGIIFPRKGRSYCSAPEIVLARSLGCKMSIRHGIIIPQDLDQKIFFPFLRQTIENRQKAQTKLENAFWKEVTNSCYGKTAQGLRRKRVFNIQREENQQLPESQITNPYFASYITSFVRAAVGEIINSIPKERMVFSVTTDGFITDATQDEIEKASSGPISQIFANSRLALTGKKEVLSEKHAVQQVLGWKTRGQATLIEGNPEANSETIVLAKAGIQPPPWSREPAEQNEYIVDLFFSRSGDQTVVVDTNTSLRDMVLYHADLVKKTSVRRLNMEYDFKRRPYSVANASVSFNEKKYKHVVFSTRPWDTVEQFKTMRSMVDDYIRTENRRCMKTADDYRSLADYFDTRNSLPVSAQKYLKKAKNADLNRLKRDLCRAFKQGQAGLDVYASQITANDFAKILLESGFSQFGIKCVRSDIENAGRNAFEPNTTPRSVNVIGVIQAVKRRLPHLDVDHILSIYDNEVPMLQALETQDPFIERIAR
ncbi:hypothetical protein KIH24_00020 [Rhizobiales bacterium TNE-4]|nr:hypothetical protein [Rhizobiales bacterium TNE-4]MBV1826001.1 hypothetical protein [Rhizobiales bacterium TNE-4]